jgi:hypothetical protein
MTAATLERAVESVLKTFDRAMSDLELRIEGTKREVSLGNLGHDQQPNVAPGFFAGEINGALRFGHFSNAAEEIDFPKSRETVGVVGVIRNDAGLLTGDVSVVSDLRVELGARDTE